jgi:hypothetical protein
MMRRFQGDRGCARIISHEIDLANERLPALQPERHQSGAGLNKQ